MHSWFTCHGVARHVFSEWCSVQLSVGVDDSLMEEMVRKYISLAFSQIHLYTMGSILHFKVTPANLHKGTNLIYYTVIPFNPLDSGKLYLDTDLN